MVEGLKLRMFRMFREHSLPRWSVLLIDMFTVYMSFLVAYMLRFNFESYPFDIARVFRQAWIVLLIYTFAMLVFKSYSGMIRHTTIRDTYKIISTVFASLAVLFPLTLLSREYGWNDVFDIPLSILVIHSIAVTVLLFFFRVFVKIFYEFASSTSAGRQNVIIYGSGEMGIAVSHVLESDHRSHFRVRCFVDDDRKRQGKKVRGYTVHSRNVLTRDFIERESIHSFIIAINNIDLTKKKEVIQSVIDLGCEIFDTPSLDTWLNGRFEVRNLRKVNLEDLLGREPITLDLEKIQKGLRGKTILVTGAAGSIGSEIARQLLRFETGMIVLLDQAETPSFFLAEELRNSSSGSEFRVIVGDVTRPEIMENVFRDYTPQVVFHAAAYKHVPMMEVNPHESVRVNVGGTRTVAELSVKYGVEKFVMISSDKAVNPTNVMGATKKICEMLVTSISGRSTCCTKFITTRFGNVLGSNGSVIPLFKNQIAEGGPVTITHPEITRFFMTIPEACQLVLEAGFMGDSGQIYVFDMGEPVRVLDMALNLIRLSGLEPYTDIEIKYTGLRPGEKLYEELFSKYESLDSTHNPKINIARVYSDKHDLAFAKIDKLLSVLYTLTPGQVIAGMKDIVPEYISRLELIDI